MSSVKNHAKRSSRSNGIFGMFAERARLSKMQRDIKKNMYKEEK